MGIGNLIMFIPALTKVKNVSADIKLVMVLSENKAINKEVATIFAPQVVNKFLIIKKTFKLWQYFNLFLKNRPDFIILRFNSFSKWNILYSVLCRVFYKSVIIGHSTSRFWDNKFTFILNYKVPVTSEHESKNYINLYLKLCRTLGIKAVKKKYKSQYLFSYAKSNLLKTFFPSGFPQKSILFNASSSKIQLWKRWPRENWIKLLKLLTEDNYNIIAVGSKEDNKIHETVMKYSVPAFSKNLSGRLDFLEMLTLVKFSSLVIAADTALLHIASLTETPIIGLFGPTDEKRTAPNSNHFELLRSSTCSGRCFTLKTPQGYKRCAHKKCMASLSPEIVFNAIRQKV